MIQDQLHRILDLLILGIKTQNVFITKTLLFKDFYIIM